MPIEFASVVLVLIALGYILGPLAARSAHPIPRRVSVR
jgi:hypothetical protein